MIAINSIVSSIFVPFGCICHETVLSIADARNNMLSKKKAYLFGWSGHIKMAFLLKIDLLNKTNELLSQAVGRLNWNKTRNK